MSKLYNNNTSGYRGVRWHKYMQKWTSVISIDGKSKTIGYFNNIEDASNSYQEAVKKYGKEEYLIPGRPKRVTAKIRRDKNRDAANLYKKEWRKNNPEKHKEYQNRYINKHHDQILERQKESNRLLKLKIIREYGGVCECCKENRIEFLTIDHINGDGSSHRKNINRRNIYKWLEKNNFPKDNYRLLCFNCNCSRGFFGYCPHEIEKKINVF